MGAVAPERLGGGIASRSFGLRNTSSSSMALRMSTMYMKQIIRLGASSEVPDKEDFEEPKEIQGILGKGGKTKRSFADENIKKKPELSDTLIFQKTTRSSCPWMERLTVKSAAGYLELTRFARTRRDG